MMLCPFRVSKTITITSEFEYGRDTKRIRATEDYPICSPDCPFHNDKNGRCLRVSVEVNKLLTTVDSESNMGV